MHALKNYTESLRENISPLSLRDFLLSQTSQIPPKYSALLIGGKRAYDLARDGKDFILSRRSIMIYEVIVHTIDLPNIDIEVLVSSGTYIRSLAPIIGEHFGTNVGYVTSLDRIEIVTPSDIRLRKEQAQSLENFDHLTSLSSDFLFPSIGKIHLSLEEYRNIQNGVTLSSPHVQNEGSYFLYYNEVLCSLVDSKNGKLIIRRNNL